MTRGWSYHRTSSPIPWPSIPKCSSVSGNLTYSSPMRRAPTSMMSPKRIFSSSFSVMEMSSSVWGDSDDFIHIFSMSSLLKWETFQRSFVSFVSFLRLSITLSCPLDLTLFPMDTQRCKMQLESCEYFQENITSAEITFLWCGLLHKKQPAYLFMWFHATCFRHLGTEKNTCLDHSTCRQIYL